MIQNQPRQLAAWASTLLLLAALYVQPVAASQLITTFDFRANQFAAHPDGNSLYVSTIFSNTVHRINLRSLEVEDSFSAGNRPSGLAFSDDGSRLFVADISSPSISVIDTSTNALIDEISLPGPAYELDMGKSGILFATPRWTDSDIMRIDTISGQYLDDFDGGVFVYRQGLLQISPDRKTLYFGNTGLSRGTLAAFDLSLTLPRF